VVNKNDRWGRCKCGLQYYRTVPVICIGACYKPIRGQTSVPLSFRPRSYVSNVLARERVYSRIQLYQKQITSLKRRVKGTFCYVCALSTRSSWSINTYGAATFYPKPRVRGPFFRAGHFFASPQEICREQEAQVLYSNTAPLPQGFAARLDFLFAASVSWMLPLQPSPLGPDL
jgi:hypothetical protein